MFEQSRETLPVAGITTERRIEIEEDILQSIELSLLEEQILLEGETRSSRALELEEERVKTIRSLQRLTVELTFAQEMAA